MVTQEETGGRPLVLAITACPTGIAHTYMAAENLQAAAAELSLDIKVETHGSIGVEGTFSASDITAADAVLIGADTVIPTERFAGKPLVSTGVDEAIRAPKELLTKALSAPPLPANAASGKAAGEDRPTWHSAGDAETAWRQFGNTLYKALMNGVSHMVPFVVTGGLLLAVALSLGGEPTSEGLVIPERSFWFTISQLGDLAFALMVPILSGYIAAGIADRPGLAPGLITGFIATTGSLYGSDAGTGFIGGIITGILSGYVALGIKKIPVHKFIAPIWPIIVIPILTTLIVGLVFIYFVGNPVAALFSGLTNYLAGMQDASLLVLGAIIGAMIAFDMGGPFNKTAFLFGGGMIAAGNAFPMGMAASAIAVPPLAVGLATLIKRGWFTKAERDSGIAALFMGFFGITEGAIPLAAARPLQVIPANVAGGITAGALAGVFGVADHVMHGGPIVAVLGAMDNLFGFVVAVTAGTAVTTALILALTGVSRRSSRPTYGVETSEAAEPGARVSSEPSHAPAPIDATAASSTATTSTATPAPRTRGAVPVSSAHHVKPDAADHALITPALVLLDTTATDRDDAIDQLISAAGRDGRIIDTARVAATAVARESQHSTSVGHAVAIPHARCTGVAYPTLGFARLTEPGVQWAEGEDLTRLVFLIAVPEDAGKTHLKLLSTLARMLMREEFRQQLWQARTPEDAVAVIRQATA